MRVVGIVSEYNPFHTGHLYHLEQVKNRLAPDGIICVMSGNFVQRGEPAIVNKWARAEMALSHGVDLVLELPALYAVRSAYWFAKGGVESLYRTGIVTHLACGVENDDLDGLARTAQRLTHETPAFRRNLRIALQQGLSFPRARAHALALELDGLAPLWSRPNNTLALAYLRILREQNIPLQPVLIKRKGSGYMAGDLPAAATLLPSATAIRKSLLTGRDSWEHALAGIDNFLPPAAAAVLHREFMQGRGPVSFDDLAPHIMTLLRRSSEEDLRQIVEVSEGLETRILKAAQQTADLKDLLERIKTKRFTYTRLQRFLIHLLLNYTADQNVLLSSGPPYLRVLGFTARGRELLREIKVKAALPVIIKGAHSRKFCSRDRAFRVFWQTDVQATNLYTLLMSSPEERIGNLDYFKGPVRCEQFSSPTD